MRSIKGCDSSIYALAGFTKFSGSAELIPATRKKYRNRYPTSSTTNATDFGTIFAGTEGNGLQFTNDNGATWSEVSDSTICTEINAVQVDPNNANNIITGLLGTYNIGGSFNDFSLYATSDGGTNWTRKGPAAHALCITPNPSNFGTQYLGTFSQGLFKSNDGFDSYSNLISGNKLIADIAVSAEDTNIVLISEIDLDLVQTSIKRSTDGGATFTNVSTITANRLTFNTSYHDSVYAATPSGLYLSTDNGLTWNAWELDQINVQSLFHDGSSLYAGTNSGHLWKLSNGTVIPISGLWDKPVQMKSIIKENGHIIVGLNGAEQDTTQELSGSLWMTSDEGNNWTEITGDMYNTNVYGNKVIASANGEVYVGTYGGGILQSSVLTFGNEEIGLENIEVKLFPNPATDFIAIANDLPTHLIFNLEILDKTGRIVLSQEITSGQQVNIQHLSSGSYELVIQTGNGKASSRFVVQ